MNTSEKPSLLLYIHGFNSSPKSLKAQLMIEFCQQNRPDIKVIVPQVSCYPKAASQQLVQLIESHINDYKIGLVGSSLGGYLSTWLNSRYGLKAALVNPAVRPYELLVDYLGEQVNPYTDEKYLLETVHMQELKALDVTHLTQPDDFWLLQQEGDEVLDYRQAVDKYQLSRKTVEPEGDHSFVGFERYPEQIIQFLEL
ncbi:esterase YqiA [Vibrio tapetis]|uniref:Putative esterase n=1 Tax=Vibrio tapetis subsp. tapetis TaxID=1671868 RepID=A0A2N8Z8D7_9VIBR|nr:esterase YqiA [Vibrio tapetis]SON48189.1 putative esterase [Vibrio tapetis subsp. tapetis]